ncbi:MAG: radical SAM protein [Thermodesulfobacteriota bacterium]
MKPHSEPIHIPACLSEREILERAREARRLSSPCRLCPRGCGVDRVSGEKGYCGAGRLPAIAKALPHFGEEPPLTGSGGAGTIFFNRCNMRCVYCQNHQISQGSVGDDISPHDLAAKMLALQAAGCSNIEPVSPSHHLPGLLEALAIARGEGLTLPVVYNTNGYESLETLELLDGIVDIYLPDLKYASNESAQRYSDAADYVGTARDAILAMHRQVGNLVVDMHGRAVRGLMIRHLVLPGNVAGSADTLAWIGENMPVTVTISLMAQYSPLHQSNRHPEINRKLSAEEYDRVVDLAWDMGFENVFVQDLAAQGHGIPDFEQETPFDWHREVGT